MLLLDENDVEFNDEWIDDLSLRTSTCFSDIEIYFSGRRGDLSSTALSLSLTHKKETWGKEASLILLV